MSSDPETAGVDLRESNMGAEGLWVCGQGQVNICDRSVSANTTSFIFAERWAWMDSISVKEFQSWKRPFGSHSENFPVPFCSKDPKALSKIRDLSKPHSSVFAKPGLKFMFSDFSPAFFFSIIHDTLLYKTHYNMEAFIIWGFCVKMLCSPYSMMSFGTRDLWILYFVYLFIFYII